jgi:hypothetical protein
MFKNGWYLLAGILITEILEAIGNARIVAYQNHSEVVWSSALGSIVGQLAFKVALGCVIGALIFAIDRYVIRRGPRSSDGGG